jgi:hypothetical protein
VGLAWTIREWLMSYGEADRSQCLFKISQVAARGSPNQVLTLPYRKAPLQPLDPGKTYKRGIQADAT